MRSVGSPPRASVVFAGPPGVWLQTGKWLWLDEYIGGGWCFFIPYLVAYVGYAALGGPVHARPASPEHIPLPSLLAVFWALHGLNVVLAAGFLSRKLCGGKLSWRPFSGRHAAWIFLLIFVAAPGLYLEFPSDPVAHLGRIFEWAGTVRVTEHSAWTKFSYFFSYSLTAIPGPPPDWLLLLAYYTGLTLLFCWQNFRLAKALGLEESTALIFATLQLVILGNGTFSFHRYYGLSSTLLAQIGVLACQTTVIKYLAAPAGPAKPNGRLLVTLTLAAQAALIGFNHVQGLVLAVVGAGGVVLWKIQSHRRAKLAALFGAVGGSALMIWISADWPSIVRLQNTGWLTSLGTFRFLAGTPATDRIIELLGPVGLLGVLLGLGWFRHRSAAAWLMVAPWIVLCLPLTSIPVAAFLATAGAGAKGDNIILFSRLFFVVPLSLPFAWLVSTSLRLQKPMVGTLALVGLLLILTTPPEFGRHHYNRLWQAVARTPEDLSFESLEKVAPEVARIARRGDEKKLLGSPGVSCFLGRLGHGMVPFQRRLEGPHGSNAIADDQTELQGYLQTMANQREILLLGLDRTAFFSFGSQAARLSGHWLTFEATLNLAGMPELRDAAAALNFSEHQLGPDVWLMTNFAIAFPQP